MPKWLQVDLSDKHKINTHAKSPTQPPFRNNYRVQTTAAVATKSGASGYMLRQRRPSAPLSLPQSKDTLGLGGGQAAATAVTETCATERAEERCHASRRAECDGSGDSDMPVKMRRFRRRTLAGCFTSFPIVPQFIERPDFVWYLWYQYLMYQLLDQNKARSCSSNHKFTIQWMKKKS